MIIANATASRFANIYHINPFYTSRTLVLLCRRIYTSPHSNPFFFMQLSHISFVPTLCMCSMHVSLPHDSHQCTSTSGLPQTEQTYFGLPGMRSMRGFIIGNDTAGAATGLGFGAFGGIRIFGTVIRALPTRFAHRAIARRLTTLTIPSPITSSNAAAVTIHASAGKQLLLSSTRTQA
jgi:hypothetical protein